MKEYLDKEELYNLAVKLEKQAFKALNILEENKDAKSSKWGLDRWLRWSVRHDERAAFKHYIADMGAADVIEVKHATYDDSPVSRKGSYFIRKCSNCLQVGAVGNYCMWCGAKMFGGDDNAQT